MAVTRVKEELAYAQLQANCDVSVLHASADSGTDFSPCLFERPYSFLGFTERYATKVAKVWA